jgi:hypothetical protein
MNNNTFDALWRPTGGTAALMLAFTVSAADKPAVTPTVSKPNWLTDTSIAVKESYDNNVLGVSGDGAMDPEGSWITTISPKLGINLVPVLGDQKTIQTFTFGYSPDFVKFHDEPDQANRSEESHNIHRIAATFKAKVDAFTFGFDNTFTYVDGDKEAPVYTSPTDSGRNAYSPALPRERREQFQDRAKITLQYDWEKWFVRPTASLLYYDLKTVQRNIAGYQNYADRSDVNGGADVGYRLNPQVAVTLGYRYGHQNQEAFSFTPDRHAVSDYQRVLVGIEGRPLKWLAVSLQAGPDFRRYDNAVEASVKDSNQLKYYGEGSITAEVTANDAINFKYKQWQWVSSTGRIPYFDSTFDLTYRHKFNKQFSSEVGVRMLSSDYTAGSRPSANRVDELYGFAASVNYAINANLALNLGYNFDMGRNGQDGLGALEKYREFDRQVVGLSATVKF